MTRFETRAQQMFPVLTTAEIEVARRFASGQARDFPAGGNVYAIGEGSAPVWLVTAGRMDIVRRDGLSGETSVWSYGPGQFSGELNQLAGAPSIAGGRAGPQGCTALPFDAGHLRALMIGSADIGETVMRALILRRAELIEDGGAGTILVGAPDGPRIVHLQGFLTRMGYPNRVVDGAIAGAQVSLSFALAGEPQAAAAHTEDSK